MDGDAYADWILSSMTEADLNGFGTLTTQDEDGVYWVMAVSKEEHEHLLVL